MIVVDTTANQALLAVLGELRESGAPGFGLHFKLAGDAALTTRVLSVRGEITALASRHISAARQLFFSEEGDIFLLATTLPRQHSAAFITDIAALLNFPASYEYVEILDFLERTHLTRIAALLEKRLNEQRDRLHAEAQKREQAQAQKKRSAILNAIPSSERTSSIESRRASRQAPVLMVIEDDVFSRRLVENVLEKNYTLTCLDSADLALRAYTETAPNLVFLDINLPDVTGHELLEKITAIDPNAYVVMLSGNADRDNIQTAMERGAKGFIAKPFTRQKLLQYIERCPTIH